VECGDGSHPVHGLIYDHLKPYAAALKVAHPLMLWAIAAAKRKIDRIDANKICDCLRCDFLPECYMASTAIRERRRTLRYRNLLVRQMMQMKIKISSLLMEAGVSTTKSDFTRPVISGNCSPATRTSTTACGEHKLNLAGQHLAAPANGSLVLYREEPQPRGQHALKRRKNLRLRSSESASGELFASLRQTGHAVLSIVGRGGVGCVDPSGAGTQRVHKNSEGREAEEK
jgi:hypothetical protein